MWSGRWDGDGDRCRPNRRRSGRRFVSGLATVGMLVGVPALATIASSPAGAAPTASRSAPFVRLAPRPRLPVGARSLGAVPKTKVISGDIGFKVVDAAGLQRYATEVTKPGSATYHEYLSPAAFRARFGPSPATIAAVQRQLRAEGLSVGAASIDGLVVRFHGPAAKVEAAFHTPIAGYQLRGGRLAYANTSPLELPATIASSVQTVIGVNDLIRPQADAVRSTGSTRRLDAPAVAPITGAPTACATAKGTAAAIGSLTYDQLAYSYGLDPLYKAGDFGAGQTIALYEQDGFTRSEVSDFDRCYFGAAAATKMLSRLTLHNVDGGFTQGDGSEAPLDIDDVSAIAPQANIQVWEAPATYQDGFVEEADMVDADQAQFLSESYGSCEPELEATYPGVLQLENSLFEQAAAQGQTFMSSSADNGSDTCSANSGGPVPPILSVSDPASQPFVLSVGGTAITSATDPPQEEVWNDGAAGGSGGGGISSVWPETSWQAKAKTPGLNSTSIITDAEQVNQDDFCLDDSQYAGQKCREAPDVSMDGSPNTGGVVVNIGGEWFGYGGTSSSTPLWAAMLADINSTKACAGTRSIGFVPPKLYGIASVPSEYAASFNDVTIGNNDNFNATDGLYPATKGYDMSTGLGTPKITGADGARGLAYYLCALPASSPPTVSALTPPALAASGGGSLTITGSGFKPSTTADVAAVSIGAYVIPASDVDVTSNTSITITPVPPASVEAGAGSATDGSGDYEVTVTLTGGLASQPSSDSRLVYYDGSGSSPVPSVAGTDPNGGVESGGTTVHIFGAGFDQSSAPVTKVTFGGVAATSVDVVNDHEIVAVTPAFKSTACLTGDDSTDDVCQEQVQVDDSHGDSQLSTLVPEFSGDLADAPPTEAGITPQPTEFDYSPAPKLTAISLGGLPAASEAGGTVATVTGKGLGILNLGEIDVGPPNQQSSYNFSLISISGTSITFVLPAQAPTTVPLAVPVSVETLASAARGGASGSSPPAGDDESVTYAPTPIISSISTGTTPTAGPTSGGALLTIKGVGFDTTGEVALIDLKYGFASTAFDFFKVTNTEVTLPAPASLTGAYGVEVCTLSGCSSPSGGTYIAYLPGRPQLSSSTPTKGKAGTTVTVTGHNLGWITAVYFGSTKAKTFSNFPKGFVGFESGDTTEFTVVAPKGKAGSKVNIRVITVESSVVKKYPKTPVNKLVNFTYKS